MSALALSLVSTLLFAVSASAEPRQQSFTYRRWLRDDLIRIVLPEAGTEGTLWFARDAATSATFCPETSEFFCFYSDYHAFAIPKTISEDEKRWEHQGVAYEVVRDGLSVSFFGQEISDLMLIRVPSAATRGMRFTHEDGYFLFSREHGLVGFGYWADGGTTERTYWLAGEKGFAAAD